MKYRIREEVLYGGSKFYTERWHEPYDQWVAALHCGFDSFKDAQHGLDYWHTQYQGLKDQTTIMHEYTPRIIK